MSVLGLLLREGTRGLPQAPPSHFEWWSAFRQLADSPSIPLTKREGEDLPCTLSVALLNGYELAPGIGYAFLGGYQCALHQLVQREATLLRRRRSTWLPRALCATEKQKGASPKSVLTTLTRSSSSSQSLLAGHKSFVTSPTLAQELLVFAKSGDPSSADMYLVTVPLPASSSSSSRVQLGEPLSVPFAPEILHSAVTFDSLSVPEEHIWSSSNAWSSYVRPFRLIEDLHVAAGATGHFLRLVSSIAHRHPLIPELLALATSILGFPISAPELDKPQLELTAAGISERLAELFDRVSTLVSSELPEDAEVRRNFERDSRLLSIASGARQLRTEKAWSKL